MWIAIASHSRNAGKTELACRVIRAFPEVRWIAVKVSGHPHGAAEWSLEEEHDRTGTHDTSRYLAAGAARAWLLRCDPDGLEAAIPTLRQLIEGADAIVESGRVQRYIKPDLAVFVRNPVAPDIKPSSDESERNADLIVTPDDAAPLVARIAALLGRARLH